MSFRIFEYCLAYNEINMVTLFVSHKMSHSHYKDCSISMSKSRLTNSDFHAWFTKLQMHKQQMSIIGVLWRISWSFPRYWPFVQGIHRSPVNSPHKGQWRGALIFCVSARINGCVNNREAGDLRRHRAHYDVTVMICHENPRKSFEYRCVIFSSFTLLYASPVAPSGNLNIPLYVQADFIHISPQITLPYYLHYEK